MIGCNSEILKAAYNLCCNRCLHRAYMHDDDGCNIVGCLCKKIYNNYLLLKDPECVSELVTEGIW